MVGGLVDGGAELGGGALGLVVLGIGAVLAPGAVLRVFTPRDVCVVRLVLVGGSVVVTCEAGISIIVVLPAGVTSAQPATGESTGSNTGSTFNVAARLIMRRLSLTWLVRLS